MADPLLDVWEKIIFICTWFSEQKWFWRDWRCAEFCLCIMGGESSGLGCGEWSSEIYSATMGPSICISFLGIYKQNWETSVSDMVLENALYKFRGYWGYILYVGNWNSRKSWSAERERGGSMKQAGWKDNQEISVWAPSYSCSWGPGVFQPQNM